MVTSVAENEHTDCVLAVAQDREGKVWFFQVLSLFLRKFDVERLCSPNEYSEGSHIRHSSLTNHLLQVLNFRRPDNGSGDPLETPSDGDLSHLHPLLLGQLLNPKKR